MKTQEHSYKTGAAAARVPFTLAAPRFPGRNIR